MTNFQTKEIQIGDDLYYLRKFKAMKGLEVQREVLESGAFSEEGVNVAKLKPEILRDIIVNGCTKGSIRFDNAKFDEHFSGKYMELYQLVAEILMFNFADPNEQPDVTEE